MRALFRLPYLLFLCCLAALAARPATPIKRVPASEVLARFKVARGGDALLLPVTLAGKEHLFLLDTGATFTVFDTSIPLGPPRRTIPVQGPAGDRSLEVFAAPDASLGGMSLKTDDPVLAMDLAKFRLVSGSEVRGFVGMAFLRRHVVRIDFDRGEVLFLKAVGPDPGVALPLTYDQGVPFLRGDLAGWGKEPFLVDTGWVCHGAGDLCSEVFELMRKKEALTVVGTTLAETLSGTTVHRLGRSGGLDVGGLAVSAPILGESKFNMLGLGFWSRFVVTFDFPNDTVYLKRGKDFGRTDLRDHSGLHILRKGGATVVDSLEPGSAADAAGVRAGDVIVQVGDEKAERLSMFQIRRLFCQEGPALQLVLRRGEKEEAVCLALGKR